MNHEQLKAGHTYLAGKNAQAVTFIGLEKRWFGLQTVARVIPQTGHNPIEGEPVIATFVSPKKLREIPAGGVSVS